MAEDEKQARELLGAKSFKLDESAELVLETDKRARPRTQQERSALLHKLIHFQIANLLLTGVNLEEAKKELIHRYELTTRRVSELARKGELPTLFAKSFATGLDPHTAFLSMDDLEDFQIGMRLSLEGIGAALSSRDGFTVIEELIPGGSADRLHLLKPKDKIIAVAQQGQKPMSVVDADLREVVRMIRGKKGTSVTLTILRHGSTTQTFDVTCVRDEIDIKDAAATITYETRVRGGKSYKVGVVGLASFYGGGGTEGRSSSGDVKNLLLEARSRGVQGIVLDLSRNGGGLLEEAVKVAGLFLRKGAIVATRSSSGRLRVQEDEDPSVSWSGPLLVITTRLSASASEILAGALKDYHRAIIAGGDHSFGKGTVQILSPLPEKVGAMKITAGMYFLPGGQSTQRSGVKADILVPSAFDDDEVGELKSDRSLPPGSIGPFLSDTVNDPEPAGHWTPVDDRTILVLAAKSRERVSKDSDLARGSRPSRRLSCARA
ncbi:MAG: PDZ domain-containing protein [Candidatus Riflebacteria bacterium]|nr:PDZ domain-containing protein [Candidatus Riflebacteria bacterium]